MFAVFTIRERTKWKIRIADVLSTRIFNLAQCGSLLFLGVISTSCTWSLCLYDRSVYESESSPDTRNSLYSHPYANRRMQSAAIRAVWNDAKVHNDA